MKFKLRDSVSNVRNVLNANTVDLELYGVFLFFDSMNGFDAILFIECSAMMRFFMNKVYGIVEI